MHSDLTIVPGTAVASLYQFFSSLAVVFTDHELAERDLRPFLLVSLSEHPRLRSPTSQALRVGRKRNTSSSSAVGAVCATRPI